MERSLENGQALNNKIQLLVVALVSFGLGATTTYLLSKKEYSSEIVHYSSNTDQPINEIVKEEGRKPFFLKPESAKESENTPKEAETSPVEAQASKAVDYFSMAKNIKAFQDKIGLEIKKSFKSILLSDEVHAAKKERLNSKYEAFFEDNKLWYKAEVDSITGDKLHLFFNYYNCDGDQAGKKKNEPRDVVERCFVMWGFLHYKQNWEQYSVSSNSDYFLWKDDMPYATLEVENLGEYAKETRILKMLVPIPDENDPMYALSYKDGKFQWAKGQSVSWRPVNDKAIKKFMDMVNKPQSGWLKP